MKYSRYLKSAEDSLRKALLLDNNKNRSFGLATQISKSAKYPIRNQIKVIKVLTLTLTQEQINIMIKGLKGRAKDVVTSQGRFREGQKLNRGAFTKS
jgi:hypothetical protein